MNRDEFIKKMQALAKLYPDLFVVAGDNYSSFGQWLILAEEDYIRWADDVRGI